MVSFCTNTYSHCHHITIHNHPHRLLKTMTFAIIATSAAIITWIASASAFVSPVRCISRHPFSLRYLPDDEPDISSEVMINMSPTFFQTRNPDATMLANENDEQEFYAFSLLHQHASLSRAMKKMKFCFADSNEEGSTSNKLDAQTIKPSKIEEYKEPAQSIIMKSRVFRSSLLQGYDGGIKTFSAATEAVNEYNDDHFHPMNMNFWYTGSFGIITSSK